jgi:hypothetical protein
MPEAVIQDFRGAVGGVLKASEIGPSWLDLPLTLAAGPLCKESGVNWTEADTF